VDADTTYNTYILAEKNAAIAQGYAIAATETAKEVEEARGEQDKLLKSADDAVETAKSNCTRLSKELETAKKAVDTANTDLIRASNNLQSKIPNVDTATNAYNNATSTFNSAEITHKNASDKLIACKKTKVTKIEEAELAWKNKNIADENVIQANLAKSIAVANATYLAAVALQLKPATSGITGYTNNITPTATLFSSSTGASGTPMITTPIPSSPYNNNNTLPPPTFNKLLPVVNGNKVGGKWGGLRK
jgi:hypothetical protein